MNRLSLAIHQYNQQLASSQKTIGAQVRQLRQAYLEQLILEQDPYIPQNQLESLEMTNLLKEYVLALIYPEDGRWGTGSEQGAGHHRHVALSAIQEILQAQFQEIDVQFLMCQGCLVGIIPLHGEMSEETVRQVAILWAINIGAQLKKRFRCSVSGIHSGMDSLSVSYHEAMCRAALLEEQESGRSEDIRMNVLLKQGMQLADLVCVERYNSACGCFQEMMDTVFKQKSRSLRNRQLNCVLSMMLCLLMENPETNQVLFEQMNVNSHELIRLKEREQMAQEWKTVFEQLESYKSRKIRGQYSEQFASIYQYMHAHFRDPGISLSMMAAEFNMSISTLSREFQKNLGQGFLESLHHMRIEAARYEIEHTNSPLSDIAISVGYTNTLTMTRAFKKYLGCTPGVFRKKDGAV